MSGISGNEWALYGAALALVALVIIIPISRLWRDEEGFTARLDRSEDAKKSWAGRLGHKVEMVKAGLRDRPIIKESPHISISPGARKYFHDPDFVETGHRTKPPRADY